ncbi:hypothetical protein PHAVU_001G221000 [Phaseolus vulgaris]|uniref:Uncharacterized protein n=1 Tax=Phaseolus vulgaris TaxID=3885 RepID=V7D247_PHAVU|nr:hypothetical protein PHAVU_001G221000g [Phaseolus vulgaris]ESW35271.1 hypothetical protein PHAVU_001G221000g [Phaseolus vulgaris]
MSGCSEQEGISFSDADRHGYEGGSDDDSEIGKSQLRRRRKGSGFGKGVVHQFAKAKKQIRRGGNRKSLSAKSRPGSEEGKVIVVDGDGSGRRRRGSGCRFCFSRPKVLESPNESPTSDPNDPNFTHAMLRTVMDKNDFYSKECNTHLD